MSSPTQIPGYKAKVDLAYSLKKKINKLQLKLENAEQILRDIGSKLMLKWEHNGIFTKSLTLIGSEADISITRTNAFKKMNLEQGRQIKELLGTTFDALFSFSKCLKLKPDMVEKFEKECQEKGLNIEQYFEIEQTVNVQKEFLEKRSKLRTELSVEENKTLDKIIESVQNNPRLGYKGQGV